MTQQAVTEQQIETVRALRMVSDEWINETASALRRVGARNDWLTETIFREEATRAEDRLVRGFRAQCDIDGLARAMRRQSRWQGRTQQYLHPTFGVALSPWTTGEADDDFPF